MQCRFLRAYSLQPSNKVRRILQSKRFLIVMAVIAATLSVVYMACGLLGQGFMYVDGHSDFITKVNQSALRVAAGMDLALASGRADPLLTKWPKAGFPLANGADDV